jgi:hypothetical protein
MPFRPPLLPAEEPTSTKHRGRYKYIDFYINLLNLTIPFNSSLKNECARPPATLTVWIHQIHAAGGASGSITMVVVFVTNYCRKPLINVPYKRTFGVPDQGQMLDV